MPALPNGGSLQAKDTYGFLLTDRTPVSRGGLTLDEAAVEVYLQGARERSRGAQKSQVKALELKTEAETQFIGFDHPHCVPRLSMSSNKIVKRW